MEETLKVNKDAFINNLEADMKRWRAEIRGLRQVANKEDFREELDRLLDMYIDVQLLAEDMFAFLYDQKILDGKMFDELELVKKDLFAFQSSSKCHFKKLQHFEKSDTYERLPMELKNIFVRYSLNIKKAHEHIDELFAEMRRLEKAEVTEEKKLNRRRKRR
jgi:uncharacterized coiled-coil DUF342 family protein